MVEISETAKLNSYVTERLRRLLEAAGTELESGVDFAVRILQSVQAARRSVLCWLCIRKGTITLHSQVYCELTAPRQLGGVSEIGITHSILPCASMTYHPGDYTPGD